MSYITSIVGAYLSPQSPSTPEDRLRQSEAEMLRIRQDLFDMRVLYSTTMEDYKIVSDHTQLSGFSSSLLCCSVKVI